jgi:Ca2+-binding RTX toxin-like protein
MFGTSRNDHIVGSDAKDFIFGFDGDDWLYGRGDHDELIGGSGFDTLLGGSGNDTLVGANPLNPNDVSLSAFEIDTLNGGTGADLFVLGNTVDFFYIGPNRSAFIEDFRRSEGDKIVLKGKASQYQLSFIGSDMTTIRTGGPDGDLIATVRSSQLMSFPLDFTFVS